VDDIVEKLVVVGAVVWVDDDCFTPEFPKNKQYLLLVYRPRIINFIYFQDLRHEQSQLKYRIIFNQTN
jgi:hypothetical protein